MKIISNRKPWEILYLIACLHEEGRKSLIKVDSEVRETYQSYVRLKINGVNQWKIILNVVWC